MHYIIYPDTLFLENFLCNLLFLLFLKVRFFHAAKGKRILFASMMTALCNTMATILFFSHGWILQTGALFPVSGVMVCYCMELKDGRRILYLLYQMVLWILVLGGILQAVEQWSAIPMETMVLTIACFTLVFGVMEKLVTAYHQQNGCMREVVLYWGGKCQHFQGFLDTGNQLTDPFSKKPVSIISEDAWNLLLEGSRPPNYYPIPFQTVGIREGMIKSAQIDYMVILEGRNSRVIERPVMAITEKPFQGVFRYSVLLHNDYC